MLVLVCGGGPLRGSVFVGAGLQRKAVDELVYAVAVGARPSISSQVKGGVPSGEPGNACRPRGPRGKEVRLPFVPSRRSVSRSLLSPSPGESGRRRRARCRPLSAFCDGRGTEGKGRERASYCEFPAGASLHRVPAHHSRPRLVPPPQPSGPCSALPAVQQGRALLLRPGHRPLHRLWSFKYAPVLNRRAPIRPRRRHPRPAARRLTELGSEAAILDRGQTTPPNVLIPDLVPDTNNPIVFLY
ncbi:hypothetical protein NDU88_006496 [Pleurodeles waltl]|uniref:Uncharacterized protein n=1 Tax=Pleurodeles waltl TaxID=8319 RepID=A0AAV7PLL6_PLEWA|nr:hypothetical protein NDU88_006496 [Pleurodeles waltl]